jgi:hypothetical protein
MLAGDNSPELDRVLERLSRAVDRYRAVGWTERVEALQALMTLAVSLPVPTVLHLEEVLVGLRSRVAHYDNPPRLASLEQRSEFRSGDVPQWVGRLAAAVQARKEGRLRPIKGVRRPGIPADEYVSVDDFCVIMSFFNPLGYLSRVRNFGEVANALTRSGVHWRCIECAFGDTPFAFPEDDNIVRIRSQSVLWQKERLLNVLISRLPDKYTKLAWVDADILFSNPNWIPDTCDALDECPVVQPFVEHRKGSGLSPLHVMDSAGLSVGSKPRRGHRRKRLQPLARSRVGAGILRGSLHAERKRFRPSNGS